MTNYNDWYHFKGNKIHKSAYVNWDKLEIGTGNEIGPFVCIGTDAQHRTEPSVGKILIGDNNIIREYSTVHLPTRFSNITSIGNNCYLMALSHIAHDCIIENDVIFSNNATLGGHVHIMKNSQVGFSVTIHQHQVIGSYCMIGMSSVITRKKEILPGTKWAGNPAKMIGNNSVGLERQNVTNDDLEKEKYRYNQLMSKV